MGTTIRTTPGALTATGTTRTTATTMPDSVAPGPGEIISNAKKNVLYVCFDK